MKKAVIIIGIILLVGVLGLSLFVSPKTVEYEADYLGIDYSTDSHEVSLNYDTNNPVVAMKVEMDPLLWNYILALLLIRLIILFH